MEIKHLRCLWITLGLHRSLLLSQHGQDPFDNLSERYKVNLTLDDIRREEEEQDSVEDVEMIESLSSGTNKHDDIQNEGDGNDDNDNDDDDGANEREVNKKLISIILKGKQFVNLNSLNVLLRMLYEYITFKLITNYTTTTTTSDTTAVNGDNEENLDMSLNDIIIELITTNDSNGPLNNSSDSTANDLTKFECFNLNNFKLKHIISLWSLLVQLHTNRRN